MLSIFIYMSQPFWFRLSEASDLLVCFYRVSEEEKTRNVTSDKDYSVCEENRKEPHQICYILKDD